MADLTCPDCKATGEPAAAVAALAICSNCGATLVLSGEEPRRAVANDVDALNPVDLATLRRARGRLARPGR